MTRKRKRVENEQQAATSVPIFSHHADAIYSSQHLSSSAGYGPAKNKTYDDYDGSGFDGYGTSNRRCKKALQNDRSENNDFKSEFERKYGYEDKRMPKMDSSDEKLEDEHKMEETNESMKTFPSELVSYLKNCASSIEEDSDEMGESIREKCLEECSGMEMELCFYESSSRLIEKIFKGSRKGACRWMETFLKLKKTRQFEALCTGCVCRCMETLMFALSTSLDVQVIEQLTDLIVDGWNDLVIDVNASHFIRSLIRVILELPKLECNSSKGIGGQLNLFPNEWINKDEEMKKKAKTFLKNLPMRRNFEKIINLILDYNLMHDFMDMESVSLLMQEVIEYDYFIKTTKTNEFLTRSLEHPTNVLKQWKGRQSSRVWQIIVKRINEDGRQSLYHSILSGKLLELSIDNCANFIVQEFIANAISEELAADVFDELLDNLNEIYEHRKWSVIKGLVQAAAHHESHQAALLLRLRTLFNSSKKSTKHTFLPNIFTLNDAEVVQDSDGRVKFDVSKGNLHGSLLLQDLLMLKHNKTVVYSMLSLSKKTILELAHDQKGSFVLQAFIKSPFINVEDKFSSAPFLKKKWWDLIDDNIASHVFDEMWDNGLFTIDEKQQIMVTLCDAQKQKKTSLRRIILKRLDARGFLENRNKWLQTEMRRMHNSKTATR